MRNSLPAETRQILELGTQSSPDRFIGSMEMYVLIGTALLLGALLFIWAAYIRKPKTRSSGRKLITKPAEISRHARSSEKRRRRRRRKNNRNPTLSETGGLPPPRSENPSSDPG